MHMAARLSDTCRDVAMLHGPLLQACIARVIHPSFFEMPGSTF